MKCLLGKQLDRDMLGVEGMEGVGLASYQNGEDEQNEREAEFTICGW